MIKTVSDWIVKFGFMFSFNVFAVLFYSFNGNKIKTVPMKKELFSNNDIKKIVKFIEQMGFSTVSHPSSLHKQIYVKDNMVIHIEEKTER